MATDTLTRPTLDEVWAWLADVPDPEIPVISVVDLGIVRELRWEHEAAGECLVVTVTPTYSGCPATNVIASDIETALRSRGVELLRLETRISPPWTTDWISEAGRRRLREFGVAPPAHAASAVFPLRPHGTKGYAPGSSLNLGKPPSASAASGDFLPRRLAPSQLAIECPRCGSANTVKVSEFGSTPCKAQYRCADCMEPFDYFKCI
jgi:ring-1,2-phenylacetyl-CoA epoxidase subunit PaaD